MDDYYSDQGSSDEEQENEMPVGKIHTQQMQELFKESEKYIIYPTLFATIQKEITLHTRFAVVDWIYRVVTKISYSKLSLFNSVLIFDILSTKIPIKKDDVQLVAAVCLWISAKVEESVRSDLIMFSTICRGQFSNESFCSMERQIVNCIGGRLSFPTSMAIMPSILELTDAKDCETEALVFLDSSLTLYDFIELPTTVIAAAAVMLGMQSKGKAFPVTFVSHSICQPVKLIKKTAMNLFNVARQLCEEKIGGIYSEIEEQHPGLFIHLIDELSKIYCKSK